MQSLGVVVNHPSVLSTIKRFETVARSLPVKILHVDSMRTLYFSVQLFHARRNESVTNSSLIAPSIDFVLQVLCHWIELICKFLPIIRLNRVNWKRANF